MSVKPVPDGYHTLTPFLTIRDAAKAIESQGDTEAGPSPLVTIFACTTVGSGMTFDAGGDLWVTSYGGGSISEYTPGQLTGSTPAGSDECRSPALTMPVRSPIRHRLWGCEPL